MSKVITEEMYLKDIPFFDERHSFFQSAYGCVGLVYDDSLTDLLERELIRKGWDKWINGKALIEWRPPHSFKFHLCPKGLAGSFKDLFREGTRYVRILDGMVKNTTVSHDHSLCPDCNTPGEWKSLAMKCPKCWKTW